MTPTDPVKADARGVVKEDAREVEKCDEEKDDGVGGGCGAESSRSSRSCCCWSCARSSLFPARRRVRFGDASARASLRKAGRAANVGCEVTS